MRLLLTGSNGFVGSHIAAQARDRGWQVTGVGRQAAPTGPVDHYLRQDLALGLDHPGEVDAVVHCAALASPWARPSDFTAANVVGTDHVVRWCREHGMPPLLYVSSSSVFYREADQLGLTEGSPMPPDAQQLNAYSRTKLAGERRTASYPGAWTIVRPRAVFGPGDTVLLPRIIAAARRGRLPRFTRSDDRVVVSDLTDVDTVAHYVLTALERGATGAYNVTNDQPVPLYPFLVELLERLDVPTPRFRMPVRPALTLATWSERLSAGLLDYREPPITRFGVAMFAWSKTFDITKARTDLGPPLVPLDAAVDRVVDWWRSGGAS
jgi:nucleoside-diphosphate-sugar epimerase